MLVMPSGRVNIWLLARVYLILFLNSYDTSVAYVIRIISNHNSWLHMSSLLLSATQQQRLFSMMPYSLIRQFLQNYGVESLVTPILFSIQNPKSQLCFLTEPPGSVLFIYDSLIAHSCLISTPLKPFQLQCRLGGTPTIHTSSVVHRKGHIKVQSSYVAVWCRVMDRLWVIDKRQNEHSNLCEKRLAILMTMFFESVSSVAGEQVMFRACKSPRSMLSSFYSRLERRKASGRHK